MFESISKSFPSFPSRFLLIHVFKVFAMSGDIALSLDNPYNATHFKLNSIRKISKKKIYHHGLLVVIILTLNKLEKPFKDFDLKPAGTFHCERVIIFKNYLQKV